MTIRGLREGPQALAQLWRGDRLAVYVVLVAVAAACAPQMVRWLLGLG